MPGRMAQWMAVFRTEGLPMPGEDEMRNGFETRARNWERFRRLFRSFDLLLSVTSQRIARPVAEWEAAWTTEAAKFAHGSFMGAYCSHTDMFNWLKFPAVSVPCGFLQGLPIGLQIVGPPGSEARATTETARISDVFHSGGSATVQSASAALTTRAPSGRRRVTRSDA